LIEISDSTLNFDLTVKSPLYARAGIVEYWVLDVAGRRLISHRDPVAGKYTLVAVYSEHESVAPLAAPKAWFCAAQALPEV
jgi:Uma2 family endonuclease